MKTAVEQKVTYLKDYSPVNFKVKNIELNFDIFDDHTIVDNTMHLEILADKDTNSIELYGAEDLKIISIKIDDELVASPNLAREGESLKINVSKKNIKLDVRTEIYPHKNLSLNGLYFSSSNYFTQNEPHGFRHITLYADRPDVMTIFKTKITAPRSFQYLLSNGNLINKGIDPNNKDRHFQVWSDPFPKPCYLFALVVGNFDVLKDKFTTKSGRQVALELYVDKGKLAEATHAMESLIRSMAWDEQKYNLEYDLDIYMVVAADSFNMGAMENKGLNIFNSKFILGNLNTATDSDLEDIEAVVAHEYFHNWTGNRVTCRDWFQLTLKEGLTVFRDQQFTADQHGEAVKRIKDVQLLRQRQFEEDAGPLSHPIRPSSYIEMNNFYTATVYEKGAEVIRMLHSIVGDENFKKSLQKYFELYDGTAATVENFIFAFENVTNRDFSSFMNWYKTKGTPIVKVTQEQIQPGKIKIILEQKKLADQDSQTLDLPIRFAWPSSLGLLPFEIEQVQFSGSEIFNHEKKDEALILLRDKTVEFVCSFPNKNEKPALSFNRNFTSPIYVESKFNLDECREIAKFDTDLFNKWDSCQNLIMHYLQEDLLTEQIRASDPFVKIVAESWSYQLKNSINQEHFTSLFYTLPSESEINEKLTIFKFEQVRSICLSLLEEIAKSNRELFKTHFNLLTIDEKKWTPQEVGLRKLKNTLLDLLIVAGDSDAIEFAVKTIKDSQSMNQQFAALKSLNKYDSDKCLECNEIFIKRNRHAPLLIDKWLMAQMCNQRAQDLSQKVLTLMQSNYFDIKVPNRVYSLVISWMNNLAAFNSSFNPGYKLMKKIVVEIDSFNPQVASRVLKNLKPLNKLPTNLRKSLQVELEEISNLQNISNDSLEIVNKFLKG